MKLDLGLTYSEKIERSKSWHAWFAWYPVNVGHKDYRWLEVVQRKISYGSVTPLGVPKYIKYKALTNE